MASRRSRVVAVAAVIALPVLWYADAYPRGVLMHARGHYEVQTYGEPPPAWVDEYARLLKERYGVRLNRVAGCDVPMSLGWYIDGYNPMSTRLLEEKFGKDIFEECDVLARQRWEAENPEQ